jgi:hypothetical protein
MTTRDDLSCRIIRMASSNSLVKASFLGATSTVDQEVSAS